MKFNPNIDDYSDQIKKTIAKAVSSAKEDHAKRNEIIGEVVVSLCYDAVKEWWELVAIDGLQEEFAIFFELYAMPNRELAKELVAAYLDAEEKKAAAAVLEDRLSWQASLGGAHHD